MALLPDKSSEVYELMFSILKNKLGEEKVTQVVCDFEHAVLNTVKQEFPRLTLQVASFIVGKQFGPTLVVLKLDLNLYLWMMSRFNNRFTCCTLSAMFLQMMLFQEVK